MGRIYRQGQWSVTPRLVLPLRIPPSSLTRSVSSPYPAGLVQFRWYPFSVPRPPYRRSRSVRLRRSSICRRNPENGETL